MIVQACLNGSRAIGYHPKLPITTQMMVADAVECVAAGAGELHIHPRNQNGVESRRMWMSWSKLFENRVRGH